ncbi:hypothetical protein LL06_02290 [Hoeflea sp. BAL378]|uniref:DUF6880 family protein n=1 Tax=Hoeflea sp. BAL378 TaxID=1547437 RepID=UPI00051306F3|nr:DUF6880 family protein [Hoeflea sp. BAL378]KGF70930.1 hypothetical protein LL06_02290 [Hoeflea sp. BAL378]
MASRTTLNAKNLETLGARRLAELLIEVSTGSAASKRRLRLELAGGQGSRELAAEVRKRLASIARARTAINWRKIRAFRKDLDTQRTIIAETIAAEDPAEAFELIWQFMGLGEPVFDRAEDGSGALLEIFRQACADAARIAGLAGVAADVLADRVFAAVRDSRSGQYDQLVAAMAPALGRGGLEQLQALLTAWSMEPEERPAEEDREILAWGSAGPIYLDEIHGTPRDLTVRTALQDIADALGDVDAYIAQQPLRTRKTPLVAAEIAGRLLQAGRAEEALAALDAAGRAGAGGALEWQLVRAEALEALGRGAEAQAYRWACFAKSLSDEHLRAFVRRLPDFEDMEAEERALVHARAFPDVHQALAFLLHWPALDAAARLVIDRQAELDGNLYPLMTAAAEALEEKHPLAATIALRSMIDFTLAAVRSGRYRHAARHFLHCQALAPRIEDFGAARPHEAYAARLRSAHGKKHGFWTVLE